MPGFDIGRQFENCSDLALPENARSFAGSYNVETARNNRFRISLEAVGIGLHISDTTEFFCESIDRPTRKIVKETIWNGADFMHVPLRQAPYDPINIVFYETLQDNDDEGAFGYGSAATNLTVADLLDWWTRGVFSAENSRVHFPNSRRTTIRIEHLTGTDQVLWQYDLFRAWPEVIQSSQLNHSVSDISKTTVSLSFDRVIESSPA